MYVEFEVLDYTVSYVNPKDKLKLKKQMEEYCYVHIETNIYVQLYLSFTLCYKEKKKGKFITYMCIVILSILEFVDDSEL